MTDRNSDVMDVAGLVAAASQPKATPGGGAFVLAPRDWTPHSLEDLQARPNRIATNHVFADVASLATYLTAYSNAENLFVTSSPLTGEISATLDYHDPADDGEASSASAVGQWQSAMWCGHRARFKARLTAQYQAWKALHRKPISQRDAGEFLEDRLLDIVEPMGADVMDMVMNFEALSKVSFSQVTRLRDGSVQVSYVEDSEARGALNVPDHVVLLVPVYEGMEPERIMVRLRFRVVDQKLTFTFVIANIEDLERQAFRRCEDAFGVAMPDVVLHLI